MPSVEPAASSTETDGTPPDGIAEIEFAIKFEITCIISPRRNTIALDDSNDFLILMPAAEHRGS